MCDAVDVEISAKFEALKNTVPSGRDCPLRAATDAARLGCYRLVSPSVFCDLFAKAIANKNDSR